MNKLQQKILDTDFKTAAKRFVLISLILLIAGGAFTGYMFRAQINEGAAYYQSYEKGGPEKQGQEQDGQDQAGQDQVGQAPVGPSQEGYNREGHKDWQYEKYGHDKKKHDDHEFDIFDSDAITRPSSGALAAGAAYAALCMLIFAAYWLLVAAWLYKAAAKAGMNRTFWGLLGLCFNLAAAAVFLAARSTRPRCPNCGTSQEPADFCRACGAPMQIKCTECGAEAHDGDSFCPHCGKKLSADTLKKDI